MMGCPLLVSQRITGEPWLVAELLGVDRATVTNAASKAAGMIILFIEHPLGSAAMICRW